MSPLVNPFCHQRCLWFDLQAFDEELWQAAPAEAVSTDKLLTVRPHILDLDQGCLHFLRHHHILTSPAEDAVVEVYDGASLKHHFPSIALTVEGACVRRQ